MGEGKVEKKLVVVEEEEGEKKLVVEEMEGERKRVVEEEKRLVVKNYREEMEEKRAVM